MRRLLAAVSALALLVGLVPAAAHTVGKGLATITVRAQTVQYNLLLAVSSTTPQTPDAVQLRDAGGAPDYSLLLKTIEGNIRIASDGQPCVAAPGSITPPAEGGGDATIQLAFACAQAPKELTIRDDLADVFGASYHTIANIQWPQGSQQFVFMPQQREVRVHPSAGAAARGAGSFFLLGVEHILTGWDHLLFLLALILRGGNLWSLFKIITAFTLAHSVTLAVAALGIFTLPERLIESVIALSIAFVAAENVLSNRALSHRWVVAFVFGLVHGFGFSNVLRELGLPKEGLVWSLLSFNLGVEAGQSIVVLLVVPLLLWVRRFRWEPRAVAVLSTAVLVIGLTLFVERALLEG